MFLPTLVTFLPFSEGVGPRAFHKKKNSIVLAADLPIEIERKINGHRIIREAHLFTRICEHRHGFCSGNA
jgi:hypothetical protein